MSNKEYDDFKELKNKEFKNYFIECIDRGSNVTILAPHGGRIEPRTDAIAKAIACQNFNYYGFIAERGKIDGRKNMHITSTNFDEPIALALVEKSKIVIAIHGCKDTHSKRDDKKEIFIGGSNKNLRDSLQEVLQQEDSWTVCSTDTCNYFPNDFKGESSENICNKGYIEEGGVQFELTASFRNDAKCYGKFIEIVGGFLLTYAS